MSEKLRRYVRPDDELDSVSSWQWPSMDEGCEVKDNALGLAPDWYLTSDDAEPLSPETESAIPTLSAQDLDAIRQAAWDEGLAQGFAQGYDKGLAQGQQEGQEQGQQVGFLQGHEEGLAAGAAEIREQIAAWQMLMDSLANPLAQLDSAAEQQLISLVLQLARALIGQEAQTSPVLLLNALKQGMALLPVSQQGVCVSLHPSDVEQIIASFGEQTCQERRWQLVADPALSPGDVQLTNGISSIDLLLAERIDALFARFWQDNAAHGALP